jgi:hypothetical protein
MKHTTKVKEIDEEIEEFKKHLRSKYDIKVVILTELDSVYRLTIPQLADIVNDSLSRYSKDSDFAINLLNKSRRDDRVLHHQVFCKMCKELNYSVSEVGRYLDKDHSTIIYSVRKATDLIHVRDNRFLTVYETVKHDVLKALEHGRNIQNIITEWDNSEPALHAAFS